MRDTEADAMTGEALLAVDDLRVGLRGHDAAGQLLSGVSFSVHRGEAVALVGESGSGKSLTALAILGLLPGATCVTGGDVRWGGRSLLAMSPAELRTIRGSEISLVSQDPMSALDPVFTVGDQIRELLRIDGASRAAADARAATLFEMVGIPAARSRLDSYPHELSGGLRQRVLIAMALSRNPALLIADEPTTALDATIQAQILELLSELRRDLSMAVLMISHDLGVVAGVSERLVVMYAGHVVETGPTRDLLRRPHHPYTKGLIECVPRLSAAPGVRLVPIAGSPPDPLARPDGCPFWPRCPVHEPADCTVGMPDLRSVTTGHAVACFHSERVA